MSHKEAHQQAIRQGRERLAGVDLAERCVRLGLAMPNNGLVRLRVLGLDMLLDESDFRLTLAESGAAAKPGDHILVLHYLICDLAVEPTGELITFRELPGGQFYWGPFCSRSVKPLVGRIGNDLDLLRKNLDRFDWEPIGQGDLGAQVKAIGQVEATLIYRRGDDEFEPTADILFDSCVKRVFSAEDASYLAGRICLGLL